MAKRKPRKKIYKVTKRKFGKEIEFSPSVQPIAWSELKRIVEKEFSNCPEEKILVMCLDLCPLGIGTDVPDGFWDK